MRRCENMEYKLDLETIIDKFKFDSSIRHNPKISVELLPYNTKFKDMQFNLKEVVGEFLRLLGQKKCPQKRIQNN